jgi:cytochrome c oxidase assembly protein subunit 15
VDGRCHGGRHADGQAPLIPGPEAAHTIGLVARPALLRRLVPVPAVVLRRLAVVAVVAQAGIAVTGSIVRVTGSGLGCPTWPRCFPDSLVPTPHPAVAALHQWVEFGNRLLSVAVVVAAVLCFLGALGMRPRRPRLVRLALVQPLGVLAQAVVGGFTVLLGLAWWSVSVHFLLSMVLVWCAVALVHAVGQGDGPPRRLVPGPVRRYLLVSTVLLALLLTVGTLVTAAGPHSGDAATPRLAVGVAALAQLHADLLCLYLGMLVGLAFTLHAVGAPLLLLWRYRALVVAVVAQGLLGGVQYALGVPEALVSLHVLGAVLVTVAAAALWVGTTHRPRPDIPEPALRPCSEQAVPDLAERS